MASGKHVFLAIINNGPEDPLDYATFTSLGKAKFYAEVEMDGFAPFAWTAHPDVADVWLWYDDEAQVGVTIGRLPLNPPIEARGKHWMP